MRLTLDEMIVSLRESLTHMGDTVDRILIASYTADQANRSEVVAHLQQEIDSQMVAMEALIIDVLATQQPVLATDLSVVKGMLVTSRLLGHIAYEHRDLGYLLDQLGIQDPQLPPEVATALPELRQAVTESIATFLHDDRVLAGFTFERLSQLERALQAVPTPPTPPALVPVLQLHLLALRHLIDAAREIAHSAPLYRYVSVPA